MAITQKQELRQGQRLVMTPQLQRAITLLRLSNMELSAYLDEELEKNPLLERAEPGPEEPEEPADGSADDGGDGRDPPDALAAVEQNEPPAAEDAPLDTDYDNVYTNDSVVDALDGHSGDYSSGQIGGRGGARAFDDGDFDLIQTLPSDVSLRDYLFRQLNVDLHDPVDRLIGAHLIEMLDEAGYVTGSLEPVAATMGCELARVEATLSLLQGFDPPGIFARSLSECLALQLKERDRLDPAMQALLDNLDLLAKGDVAGLIRVCGVDGEDIAQMTAEIKTLDPKPGLVFNNDIVQTLVPDVFVRERNDGGWRVELNNDTLPRVLVNSRYLAVVTDGAKTSKDKAYISEHLSSANWLVRSLDQRANTILRVATELVRRQEGFLTHGVKRLRPLRLRDIAEEVEMHESTVSRVTTNKYMATPRGTFELKYFFTSAIASTDGDESHSAETVRHRIKTLIEAESAGTVLSDEGIAAILAREGIDIARRTVAKYREAMRIPSSVRRRWRMRSRI